MYFGRDSELTFLQDSRSLEHWMTLDGRKDAEIRTLEVIFNILGCQSTDFNLSISVKYGTTTCVQTKKRTKNDSKNGRKSWVLTFCGQFVTFLMTRVILQPYVLTAKTPSEDQDRLKLINELGSKVARVVTWLKESMEDESNRFLFFTKVRRLTKFKTCIFNSNHRLCKKEPAALKPNWQSIPWTKYSVCQFWRVRILAIFSASP